MNAVQKFDFRVPSLGACRVPSPVRFSTEYGDSIANYVSDSSRIVMQADLTYHNAQSIEDLGLIERAGPREFIYFNPTHVRAGIVTCGGLCPGLNDVIRAAVRCLWFRYGVRNIMGIRYGYHGLLQESLHAPMELNPQVIESIHRAGGSILGSSRGGGERIADIVDGMERLNMNMLLVIGGDGTQKGALRIAQEVIARGLKIAVVGVPKTIDNDISFVQRSFGFETAVAKATEAVWSAHAEASSALNGIGLVKVMGRQSGFIAAHTAIASHVVDIALVPEVPFTLMGAQGLFGVVHRRLQENGNVVIVVAEGAGQELLSQQAAGAAAAGAAAADVLAADGLAADGLAADVPTAVQNDGVAVGALAAVQKDGVAAGASAAGASAAGASAADGSAADVPTAVQKDASGNAVLADIGAYLQVKIKEYFAQQNVRINLKYINPSYIIRSAIATPADSLYCSRLATNAVHALMAGKTNILISLINNHFVHVPIHLAVSTQNSIDPESSLWRDVIESTGQPLIMNGSDSVV